MREAMGDYNIYSTNFKLVTVFLFTMALVFCADPGMAWAAPASHASCMAKNKQFGGSTAACASEICDWEACKNRVIYRMGTSRQGTSAGEDPGAWGSALATCMPFQSMMQECQKEHKGLDSSAFRSKPKSKREPYVPWCKTGDDMDTLKIRVKLDALKAKLLTLRKTMDELANSIKKYMAARQALKQPITSFKDAFRADGAAVRAGTMTYDDYKQYWESGGNLQRGNDLVRSYREQDKLAREANAEWKRLDPQFQSLRSKYIHVARDLMDRDHDCAGAMEALR